MSNERTFLAWIRTSLGFLAAALAVRALQVQLHAHWRTAVTLVFVAVSLLAAVSAWLRWASTERALRERAPLPGSMLFGVLAAAVTVSIVAVALAVLL